MTLSRTCPVLSWQAMPMPVVEAACATTSAHSSVTTPFGKFFFEEVRVGSMAEAVPESADHLVQRVGAVVQRRDARQDVVDTLQPNEVARHGPGKRSQPDPLESP